MRGLMLMRVRTAYPTDAELMECLDVDHAELAAMSDEDLLEFYERFVFDG